jgi:hypothetical protein
VDLWPVARRSRGKRSAQTRARHDRVNVDVYADVTALRASLREAQGLRQVGALSARPAARAMMSAAMLTPTMGLMRTHSNAPPCRSAAQAMICRRRRPAAVRGVIQPFAAAAASFGGEGTRTGSLHAALLRCTFPAATADELTH